MKTLVFIVLTTASVLNAKAISERPPMDEINRLLQTLIAQHPWPPNDSVMEEEFLESDEFVQLKKVCTKNWISILNDFDSVVGEDVGKIMLFTAFEDLDADIYMTALERLAEKFQQGKITETVMRGALSLHGWKMRKFLIDNYRHPRVRALLNGLKPYFDGDASMQARINNILSGRAKRGWDSYRKAHKGVSEMNVFPQILLDNPNVVDISLPSHLWLYAALSLCVLSAILYFLRRKQKTGN
jgi:hypothetical protein